MESDRANGEQASPVRAGHVREVSSDVLETLREVDDIAEELSFLAGDFGSLAEEAYREREDKRESLMHRISRAAAQLRGLACREDAVSVTEHLSTIQGGEDIHHDFT